jgi:hypothetical protein
MAELIGLNLEPFRRIRASPVGQRQGDNRMFPNLEQYQPFLINQ